MTEGQEAHEAPARVHLSLEGGYRFLADFGDGRRGLRMDEPPPLGEGAGPNASAVLGAAVANCLSASLLFCLHKAHVEVQGMTADAEVSLGRNDRSRLRVQAVHVELRPQLAPGTEGRIARCLELYEDFCVVTAAVRGAIDVEVTVTPVVGAAAPSDG